jgi:predicted P-loop ATPase
VAEPADFDLLAASLRADTSDLRAFVEALAAKLETSFPERVRVERGGFLGGKRVRRIAVDLADNRYELEHDDGRVSCHRRNVVRGIALKNEELPVDEWIDDLSRRLLDEAGRTERGRQALERLLDA